MSGIRPPFLASHGTRRWGPRVLHFWRRSAADAALRPVARELVFGQALAFSLPCGRFRSCERVGAYKSFVGAELEWESLAAGAQPAAAAAHVHGAGHVRPWHPL